jgi:hypothetical protein
MEPMPRPLVIAVLLALLNASPPPANENATVPGALIVQEPTLICLGFEWRIAGDRNENCRVEVHYRVKGAQAWHGALPMFRVENIDYRDAAHWRLEHAVPFGNRLNVSLFDLEPATAYEVRFTLTDPDGGAAEKIVTATTRPEPRAYDKGRTLHVVPGSGGGSGSASDPFRGPAAADAAARPGDILLFHEGVYPGPYRATRDGAPGKPIVWRGVDAAKVLFDGQEGDCAVGLQDRRFVYLENVTIRNAQYGVRMERGSDLAVQRCVITNCDQGIANWPRIWQESALDGYIKNPDVRVLAWEMGQSWRGRRFLIRDNRLLGNMVWGNGVGPGAQKEVRGHEGIVLTGDGHVIAHNFIRGFSDGLSLGNLDRAPDGRTIYAPNDSVDIYENEVSNCPDDGFELDFGRSNIRCFRNRVTNSLKGVSCQPVFGGPIYILRNALVNNESCFKFHVAPSGMVMLHNTCISDDGFYGGNWHNGVMRNNLLLANKPTVIQTAMQKFDLDHNGYLPGPGTGDLIANRPAARYRTLEQFRAATGQEQHGLLLSRTDLAHLSEPHAFSHTYQPGELDLALNPSGKAVDAGERLPNVNDDFTGKAPDLGCYESGKPLPHYGPRLQNRG